METALQALEEVKQVSVVFYVLIPLVAPRPMLALLMMALKQALLVMLKPQVSAQA